MRGIPEPYSHVSPMRQPAAAPDVRQKLLLIVPPADAAGYGVAGFTRLVAHTTADAIRLIESERPRLAVLDWDNPTIDGVEVCRAAQRLGTPSMLITTSAPERVPSALKCGVHGVLLKPFAPNLLAGRLGRLLRETSNRPGGQLRVLGYSGTNRVWADVACGQCGNRGATSFDFSNYRRMWYACLACESVWLGPRRE